MIYPLSPWVADFSCSSQSSSPLPASAAHAYTKTDHWLPMGDGVTLAATLYAPDGAPPQAAGRPLSRSTGSDADRSAMNAVAEAHPRRTATSSSPWTRAGTAPPGGQSSLVGPRDRRLRRALQWLRLRPGVADARVGALGFAGRRLWWKLLTAPGTRLAAAVP